VADRSNLARFPAQYIEHTDPVPFRCHVGERVDAEIVGEAFDALLEHGSRPLCGSGGVPQAELGGDGGAAAASHPVVDLLGVIDHLGDRAVEAEEPVGQAEAIQPPMPRTRLGPPRPTTT
jgi:hypothetical protein